MRFNLIGNLQFNDADSDRPFIRKGTTKTGAPYLSLNGSVVAAKNNRAFIECFGMQYSSIKTFDTDNNKIEVAWADRNDDDIKKSVASYRKHIIKMDGATYDFITEYDFIEFIKDNVDTIKTKKWQITGQTQFNEYQGKTSQRFVIGNLYEVADDTKNQLRVTINETWTGDDVDLDDWKSDKKIYINGFTKEYIDKDHGQKYIPQQVVFDASKIDFDNEKHIKLLQFKLSNLGLKYEDGAIKNTLKSNKVYTLPLITNYTNGAEEVEFDESLLTDNQREAVELGLKELKDFAPSGSIYGERVIAYKVIDFILRDDSADGVYDTEMTTSEFDDEKYIVKEVSLEDAFAEPDDDDDEDLFA